jgi:uncharacterized repeat protein (TIGR02543 family)
MKQTKFWLGLLAAAGMAAVASAAHPQPRATEEETHDGVKWSFSLGENEAIVMRADPAAGALSVPSTLGGQPVAEIGYTAFASCDELTSVTIPAGVGNIGERAFQYCSLLEEVSLPAGVTNIGAMAFQYCDSLASLTLPQSVEDIGTNALFHCDVLAKLYAPWAWWNTRKAATAGVGTGCTVIYGEPGKVTLVFDANGGTCDTRGRGYTLGEPYGWLPEASRDSYSFAGWWTATNGGTRVWDTDTAASSEGWQPLYVRWVPLTQEVTFDPNGGTCDTTNRIYNAGEPYSPLPAATREHYDFVGWWTESVDSWSATNITEEILVTTNATRTLYAHWTLVEQAVTFDPNGGACDVTSRIYAVGSKYSPLPKATREAYAFDGWFTATKGGDRLSAASAVTMEEYRTLYAHWTLSEQIVTFNANGGTCDTASRAYTVGENYGWLPEATRADGAAFSGWYALTPNGWVRVAETDVVTVERSRGLWAAWDGGGEDAPVHVSGFPRDGETGGFQVEFAGTEGKTYALQRTRELDGAAAWATVKTLEADRSGILSMAVETPAGWNKGFYRVVEPGSGSGLPANYLVLDLSAGSGDGVVYPVSYLDAEPEEGWTDEYKTTKLVLRLIRGGTYTMGSPTNELGRGDGYETQHEVTISKPFYMGVFEVTQRQWELVMGSKPSYFKSSCEKRPVEQVSYYDIRGNSAGSGWPGSAEVDATSFLGRLRARTGVSAFDLPTEAQWEYACRAGTETALNSGKNLAGKDSCPNMAEVGRYWYNGGGNYHEYGGTSSGTAVVGSYKPNAWGLYDMHGNVCEWCLDWWTGDLGSGAATDPVGNTLESNRVPRGGGWYNYAKMCRSAFRTSLEPSYRNNGCGFRLACVPGL